MMERIFYVAACSEKAGGGIYSYKIKGEMAPEQVALAALPRANYMAFSPDRKYLFSTCSIDGEGGVASFAVQVDGALTPINRMAAGGLSTCHVITDPGGKYLYAANYLTGNFAEFKLVDGRLVERTQQIHHDGKGPDQARQDGPHTHFCGITPDGRYLCVIDLGIDAIMVYPLDSEKGVRADEVIRNPVNPGGSGPRHLVFGRSGRIAYLLNELGNTVMSYQYAEGRFTHLATRSTLPPLTNVETKAAAIRLSEDERYLFATNRGFDSIAVYRLDGSGGMEPHDLVLTGGSSPRDINFLPGYKTLAVANEFSDQLIFFDYDAENGKLTPNGIIYRLPRPLCVMW